MSNNTKESEWKNRERGALWKKQGKNQNYLTGIIKSLDDMGQEVKNKVILNKLLKSLKKIDGIDNVSRN